MQELENNIRTEETDEIKRRLKRNEYSDEAKTIAEKILIERKQNIPLPETQVETQNRHKANEKITFLSLVFILFWIALIWSVKPSALWILISFVSLVGVLKHLHNRRER